MLPVMPALLAAVMLLLAAPPATVPPGTYVLADAGPLGEAVVIAFKADGSGVLVGPGGSRGFDYEVGEGGLLRVEGAGEFEFVADGRGLLLAPIDDDQAAWGVRVEATPAEAARALRDVDPRDAVGLPFVDSAPGDEEAEATMKALDDFAGVDAPADEQPSLRPATRPAGDPLPASAGIWVGRAVYTLGWGRPMDPRDDRAVLVVRDDGHGRLVERAELADEDLTVMRLRFGDGRGATLPGEYELLDLDPGEDDPLDGLPATLTLTGDAALLVRSGGGEVRRDAVRALLFRRTDLPPSAAVGRHLLGED